jgi:type I restriction enzyme M protein
MALKKSELYASLWKSCDELRGGMDASQYKDYVLVLLFVKYVSDKYANDPDGLIEVPPGGRFADMVAAKGDKQRSESHEKLWLRRFRGRTTAFCHPFRDNRVASQGSQMTRRAFGMPCSLSSDGVITPPAGKPPAPGPSRGHKKHPGLAANAADLCFSAMPCMTSSPCAALPALS